MFGYRLFILILVSFALGAMLAGGCKKKETCYDESKVDSSKACSLKCSLICGCDGKEYCNPCEAEKVGIVSFEYGPC